jgi:signal transduction histidine kinase
MPRAKTERSASLRSSARTLDLILWSGHKSLLTSPESPFQRARSYRELQRRTLQGSIRSAARLDRLKSNFLGVVSHELRTPLTSIIGYSEMLVEGIATALVGDQQKFVQTINDKGQQLLQLIMSLLDLSSSSGTMSMKKGTVAIGQLLSDVGATSPKARKRTIEIDAAEPGLPDVQGDPDRLRRVFVNLVDNAVKFSPEGGTIP